MTPKRIIFDDHVRGRLRQRRITRQDVRFVLARGIREPATTLAGAQRWSRRAMVRGREMRVVFIETRTDIIIVTAEWIGDVGDEVYT